MQLAGARTCSNPRARDRGSQLVVEPVTRDQVAPSIEELVDRYQDRLLNFAVRLLGSREDAEEVVQDTFAKADRALRRATLDRPIDPTAAWFYTIALNTVRNRRRRRRLVTVAVEEVGALVDRDVSGDPERMAARRETRRQVERALAGLPDHQRVPVILRFIEDLSYDEIAAIVGCPVGTAKSHVHRGIRRLRRAWEEDGGEEHVR